jgi:hypothetical protein
MAVTVHLSNSPLFGTQPGGYVMDNPYQRIARVIQEYDAQGWHRTGTEVDRRSGEWLAGLVRECGLEAMLEPFSLSRLDPQQVFIEVEGRRVEGLPLFDGGLTGPDGVRGCLGPLGSEGEIQLIEGEPRAVETWASTRRTSRCQAMVAVTTGRRPGLAPWNAYEFMSPFGPPILQVSSTERDWLCDQAQAGSEVHLVTSATRMPAQTFNVVATIPGRDMALAPLLVMTPRSGWWSCASERGGGLACWLELLMAVKAAKPTREVRFLASSGHELGHLGLEAFLARCPGLATGAHAWIHLGANIGAAQEPEARLFASDDELEDLAVEPMTAASLTTRTAPRGTVPGGESRNIHQRGGRYVSLIGNNARFHLEEDRWPEAVDVVSVSRHADAVTAVALSLASA